ncbi:MAG: hypothetical protein QT01_C0006G0024 [archaeon GW2011_AR6]|nr:MAG: hypothetical protein QT01_C0006G0024 [archaeon GW2011_AR6]
MTAKSSEMKSTHAPSVKMYSTPSCVYCNMAKSFFKRNNVKFEEADVASDLKAREEMFRKSGQMGVPVIDVGGKIVIGFDERTLRTLLHLK